MTVTARERAKTMELAYEFRELVNMTPATLEHWLDNAESKSVGQFRDGDDESVGHHSGRAIIDLLHGPCERTYTESEIDQMHRTVSYIKRHLAQRPNHGDIAHSRWASSLKNWGHDPTKEKRR